MSLEGAEWEDEDYHGYLPLVHSSTLLEDVEGTRRYLHFHLGTSFFKSGWFGQCMQ